jgi:TIR domain
MIRGFISYAHDDCVAFNEMMTHLRATERAFKIKFWADKRIKAGNYWSTKIADAIEAAKIHILMLSPAYIRSDYIFDHELPAINDKCAKGDLVLPVIIDRCSWQFCVGPLQAAPVDTFRRLRPVLEWNRVDTDSTPRESKSMPLLKRNSALGPKRRSSGVSHDSASERLF